MRILLICLLLSACSPTPHVKPADYAKHFATAASKPFPHNRPINIVFHGNSVPVGYGPGIDIDALGAYPYQLLGTLNAHYRFAQINILVTAKGGEVSEQGEERFDEVLRLNPDVVILDYGLNDWQIGLDRSEKAMDKMISKALDAGSLVIVMTPSPDTRAEGDGLMKQVEMLKGLAKRRDVALCDSHAAFAGRDLTGLMAQYNHPNRAGHRLIESRLREFFIMRAKAPKPP